jgi:hypothetical protein
MQQSCRREPPPDDLIMRTNASAGNRFQNPRDFGILPHMRELGAEWGVER